MCMWQNLKWTLRKQPETSVSSVGTILEQEDTFFKIPEGRLKVSKNLALFLWISGGFCYATKYITHTHTI